MKQRLLVLGCGMVFPSKAVNVQLCGACRHFVQAEGSLFTLNCARHDCEAVSLRTSQTLVMIHHRGGLKVPLLNRCLV